MGASSTVRVSILGDASSLNKAFSDSQTGAEKWGGKMQSAGKGLTLGLTAPIVAGAALAVKAGAEEQQQMETLANSIRQNIPGATDDLIASNEEWISSMQSATGVADSEMRQAMQHLVTSGMSLEDAQKNVAIAMDIAAAKGKPLATVTEAINKANNGNIGALGRLGIAVRDTGGEYMSLEEIMATAEDRMGGSAAAAADTAAGRAQILTTQMDDLSETIGMILLPVVEKLTSTLSDLLKRFDDLSPGAKKAVVAFGAVAAAVGPVLFVLGKVVAMGPTLIKGFQAVGKAWGILSKLFMANPWILLIAAIIALVILIIANWDKIKIYLEKTWAWITKTSAAVWDALKKAVKAALDFVVNLFLNWTLAGLIIKHWDKIKEGIANLKDWIIRTWNSIVDWFKGLPARIGSAVSGMWDGIKTAFRNAINWIIKKWNDLSISIGGGTILGVDIPKITVSTPNIPTFQSGGMFRSPAGSSSGLALLHDRERVLPAGRAAGGVTNLSIPIYAGIGSDPNAIAKAVLEALQRYQRVNGPLPLDVRLN